MKYITILALLLTMTNITVHAKTIQFSGAIAEFTCSEKDTQSSCVKLRQLTTSPNIQSTSIHNLAAKAKASKNDMFSVTVLPVTNNQHKAVIVTSYY